MNQPAHRMDCCFGRPKGAFEDDLSLRLPLAALGYHRSESEAGRRQAYPWRRPSAKMTKTDAPFTPSSRCEVLIRKVPAAGASLSERLKAHWGDTSPFDAKVILLEELKNAAATN